MPVVLTVWSTFSHTMGIFNLVAEQYHVARKENDITLLKPGFSKLYGYSYTGNKKAFSVQFHDFYLMVSLFSRRNSAWT